MIPWWSEHTAGWIGAIAGTATGLLGGLIGTLAGVFVPRGKLKRLVYGLFTFAIAFGIVALTVGLYALAAHQPYAVWYPLTLVGALNVLGFGIVVAIVPRGYRQADARRLEARELRQG